MTLFIYGMNMVFYFYTRFLVDRLSLHYEPNYLRAIFVTILFLFVCHYLYGRFYKLVLMEGSVSILLGCLYASRTVSFCFSFGHVARYVPSRKAKTYGTIAENSSQANL